MPSWGQRRLLSDCTKWAGWFEHLMVAHVRRYAFLCCSQRIWCCSFRTNMWITLYCFTPLPMTSQYTTWNELRYIFFYKTACVSGKDWSVCASTQTDRSLCYPPEGGLNPWLPTDRLGKALIRLHWALIFEAKVGSGILCYHHLLKIRAKTNGDMCRFELCLFLWKLPWIQICIVLKIEV